MSGLLAHEKGNQCNALQCKMQVNEEFADWITEMREPGLLPMKK